MEAKLRMKRKLEGEDVISEEEEINEIERPSKVAKAGAISPGARYVNKQRVLLFSSRGIPTRHRHFMDNLRKLMPHHKKEVKLDVKNDLRVVNEIAEIKSCNTTLFFEARKRQDLFMWMAINPTGPSVKFHVQNVHTMEELRMTGNCLLGSRALLNFDEAFNGQPHLQLLKRMFTQVFGCPRHHPKSKPFIDRVMCFYYADGKVWVRQYQIVEKVPESKEEIRQVKAGEDLSNLAEIGPRFVLNPVRIFKGCFGGATLYQNASYVSPNALRSAAGQAKGGRYAARIDANKEREAWTEEHQMPASVFKDVFK